MPNNDTTNATERGRARVRTAEGQQVELLVFKGASLPRLEQLQERYGVVPDESLVDEGYSGHSNIDALAGKTTVYAPVPQPKDPGIDSHEPKKSDSHSVAAWQRRMVTQGAKKIYKECAATAQCVMPSRETEGSSSFSCADGRRSMPSRSCTPSRTT